MKIVKALVALSLGLALLAGASMLSGCVSLPGDAGSQLAIQYATAKVIEGAAAPAERAEQVRTIAEGALQLVDGGESVSLSLVESAVMTRICWACLSPADQMLARALVSSIRAELETRVGAGELDAERVVPVRAVLTWVIEATRYAVPDAAAG